MSCDVFCVDLSLRCVFRFFFVFRFVIVVERRLGLLFVATVLASLLISTQTLFDFVRRLIRLDDVFSFELLVVSGDLSDAFQVLLDRQSSKLT